MTSTAEEVAYLETDFLRSNGARPHIKFRRDDRTPDGSISGFLPRTRLPRRVLRQLEAVEVMAMRPPIAGVGYVSERDGGTLWQYEFLFIDPDPRAARALSEICLQITDRNLRPPTRCATSRWDPREPKVSEWLGVWDDCRNWLVTAA